MDLPPKRIKPNDVIVRIDGVEFTDGKATPDDVSGSIRDPARSRPPFN